MSILGVITRRSRSGLIVIPAVPPLNNPPVWDSQPAPIFIFGTASNYDMDDITSDPDADTIEHSLNTGTASLPTGVTWTASTGILAYNGTSAVATTSGHIATIDDGTDTTDSTSFSIRIASTWPVNGWAMQGGYMISDQPKNMETDPWRGYNGEKEVLIYQWRNQTTAQKAAEKTRLEWFETNHPDCKMVQYITPGAVNKVSDFSAQEHSRLLIADATDGHDSWYLKNSSGAQVEAKFSPTKLWKANEADTVVDNNSLGEPYSEAFHKTWYDLLNDATSPRLDLIDGQFHDVCPPVPQTVKINDGANNSNFDYEEDGSSTNRTGTGADGGVTLFQAGINQWRTNFNTKYGNDKAYWGNITSMGLDYDAGDMTIFPVSDNAWYQAWDGGILEGGASSLNLERTGTGYTNDGGGNPTPLKFLRRLALIASCLKTTSLWGINAILVEVFLNNRTETAIDYDAMRLVGGMCALTGHILGTSRGKATSSEPLDEFVYDWGDPIDGTHPTDAMGVLDLSDATFAVRSADFTSGGAEFHWIEFDNIIWVVRTDWFTQGAGDLYGTGTVVNCELPDPGTNKKWIHPDLSAYTHPTSGRSTRGQNNTLNSGNDVTSGGSFGVVSLVPAYAVMCVRVAV